MEQHRYILRTLTAVRTSAASDVRMRECFFRSFQEQKMPPTFFDGSPFLQSILAKEKASAKTALSDSVLKSTEFLLWF